MGGRTWLLFVIIRKIRDMIWRYEKNRQLEASSTDDFLGNIIKQAWHFLKMHLFIHDLAIQNLEGVEMNTFMERENGISNGWVVGKSQVFLRWARGRCGMTMPVGEYLQAFLACIS